MSSIKLNHRHSYYLHKLDFIGNYNVILYINQIVIGTKATKIRCFEWRVR